MSSRTALADGKKQAGTPDRVVLEGNYPNPFNPSTKIGFRLPEARKVKLTVYNILGRKVATLINKRLKAGHHQATFNSGNLSSGIYLYHLKALDFSNMQKMTLVK